MICRQALRSLLLATSAMTLAAAVSAPAAQARVTRITIEKRTSPAFNGAAFGAAGQYETLTGRAYGELDPKDSHNAIITDIQLAPKNARGMVEYTATFQIVKPIDMSKASHLMWHDVPNRAGRVTIVAAERNFGDVGLSSGWQATIREPLRRRKTTTMPSCQSRIIRMAHPSLER